jgi:hypothetical protein
MRTGNTTDGMYFFLLVIPFVLSFWIGDLVRIKIVSHLILESFWSKSLSGFAGILVEILIITTGVSVGFLLIILI